MILNISNKPFESFSASQRLALKSEKCYDVNIKTFEEFEEVYDKYNNVTGIIVDNCNGFVLVNDVLNCVICPVFSLDIEIILQDDSDEINFLPYEEENI